MDSMPRISETEWLVMKVLWSGSPLTANQVIEALMGKVDWSPLTVRTLLGRLVSKKAISQVKANHVYEYSPLVTEKECVQAENKTFLKKVHDGALKSMMASFIEGQELSQADIDELKAILEGKEPDRKDR